MIYVGTIIVHAKLKTNQTFLQLAAQVESVLGALAVPWQPSQNIVAKHLACLTSVEDENTPQSGIVTHRDMRQRLLFELYGPQGLQGNETNGLVELKVKLINALGAINARLQIVDFYGDVEGRVEYLAPPPEKKTFGVGLTTLAMMKGTIEVQAVDEKEAEEAALQRTGDVHWDYMGTCEGDQGPEVQDVQASG